MATQTLTNAQSINPVTGGITYTSGLVPDSSLSSLYNPGTNSGGSATNSLTPYTVDAGGTTPNTGNAIATNLNSAFAPTQNTIMQNYDLANTALGKQAEATAKTIADTGQYNLAYSTQQSQNQLTQNQESQRGFAVNPGSIAVLQQQADKRIRDLNQQMNDALANNNAQLGASISQNIAAEQTAITNARTVFLNQYFQSQTEARAQATFKTPEQTQVLAMAAQYPDAGILPTDDLATAQQKVSGSTLYKTGLASTKAATGLAGAQAGLAGVQATQVGIINKFLGGDTAQFKPDEDALINKSATDATLHAKYDSYPGGVGAAIISGIESRAQARGWSPQQSYLTSTAQQQQTAALNSGNPAYILGGLVTQGIGAFGSALGGSGSAFSPTLIGSYPAGTDGAAYGFPGYVSNGITWKKK